MPSPFLHAPTLAALAALVGGASTIAAQSTRPERTGGAETSSYADVTGFLDSLARRTRDLRLATLGTSAEGRAIPWVLAARPMVEGPAAAARSGKPVIYIQGNIHSGEVEGKEAAQMLLRDLTTGPLSGLLDSVIVLVVPIYNTDGNEKFGPGERNRPGQNGPAVVGPSLNGQGLNLNRDYVKVEAPETRAAYALLAAWDPDVFIDLHTTNGSYPASPSHESPRSKSNSFPANDVRDRCLVQERPAARHSRDLPLRQLPQPAPRLAGAVVGDLRCAAPLRHQRDGCPRPDRHPLRGLQQRSLPGRIRATYLFLREILSLAAEERATIRRVVAAADRWRPDSIALRSVFAPPHTEEVIAELTDDDGDGSHGFARRRRSGVFRALRMPVYDRFAPAAQVARPAGYLLPPGYGQLAGLLRTQGVVVERLRDPWSGSAARFQVDSLQVAPFVFEGHRTVTVHGAWGAAAAATATAGWYWVSTDQRLGTFAACLLEPGSEDGYATWNYLDRDLRRGAPLPILRLALPVSVATEVLP